MTENKIYYAIKLIEELSPGQFKFSIHQFTTPIESPYIKITARKYNELYHHAAIHFMRYESKTANFSIDRTLEIESENLAIKTNIRTQLRELHIQIGVAERLKEDTQALKTKFNTLERTYQNL